MIQKPMTWDSLSGPPVQSVYAGMGQAAARSWVEEPLRRKLALSLLPPLHFASHTMFVIFLFFELFSF